MNNQAAGDFVMHVVIYFIIIIIFFSFGRLSFISFYNWERSESKPAMRAAEDEQEPLLISSTTRAGLDSSLLCVSACVSTHLIAHHRQRKFKNVKNKKKMTRKRRKETRKK